jgi:hypothetical protein
VAGAGLCLLELGRLNAARGALADVQQDGDTADWFQGREMAEALAIRIDAADGRFEKALGELEHAVALAEEPTSTMPRG